MKNKIAIVVFFTLMLSGCVAPRPAMKEYTLDTQVNITTKTAKSCKNKTIKIAKPFAEPALMRFEMRYTKGKFQEFSYSQSQWANVPVDMIYKSEVDVIRDLQLFKSVQIANSKTKNDLLLETNVNDFMQYYDTNVTNSYAHVGVTFTLINVATHEVIDTQTFESRKDTQTLNAKGGVVALNAALSEVLQKAAFWVEEVCK